MKDEKLIVAPKARYEGYRFAAMCGVGLLSAHNVIDSINNGDWFSILLAVVFGLWFIDLVYGAWLDREQRKNQGSMTLVGRFVPRDES